MPLALSESARAPLANQFTNKNILTEQQKQILCVCVFALPKARGGRGGRGECGRRHMYACERCGWRQRLGAMFFEAQYKGQGLRVRQERHRPVQQRSERSLAARTCRGGPRCAHRPSSLRLAGLNSRENEAGLSATARNSLPLAVTTYTTRRPALSESHGASCTQRSVIRARTHSKGQLALRVNSRRAYPAFNKSGGSSNLLCDGKIKAAERLARLLQLLLRPKIKERRVFRVHC